MARYEFFAPGIPQTKGSTKAFVPRGWRRAIVTNDNAKAKPWQGTIALAARAAGVTMLPGAASLTMTFRFLRPKSHIGKRGLRASAPARHTQKPDIDKCVRVVLDALTGIAYADDSQVVDISAEKRWVTGEAGVRVVVDGLDGVAPSAADVP